MTETRPLTRRGTEPHPAGRAAVSDALARLLDDGKSFCDVEAHIDGEAMRSWLDRVAGLTRNLADFGELPQRNRILELLATTFADDAVPALWFLRLNLAGVSPRQLGAICGVAANTINRIERGAGCGPRVAKALADEFSLGVDELFGHEHGSKLHVRSVGGLRDAMTETDRPYGLIRNR